MADLSGHVQRKVEGHVTAREWLGVPSVKYREDPLYRLVVDSIEAVLHRAEMTPSEVREAAVLACIHYEERNTKSLTRVVDGRAVLDAREAIDRSLSRLEQLRAFLETNPSRDDDAGSR